MKYRLLDDVPVNGPARIIEWQGRKGINAQSIRTRLSIPQHTINNDTGALTLWVLPLEDLASTAQPPHVGAHDPGWETYTLLADQPELRALDKTAFALAWQSTWYPQYFAKFHRGNIYPDSYHPPRAAVTAGHLNFHRGHWYQLGVTWDKPRHDYRLYVNGVLIAMSNRFAKSLEHHPCGETLFAGNPCFALGDLAFSAEATPPPFTNHDPAVTMELQRIFAGAAPQRFEWKPTDEWQLKLYASLTKPEHLDLFYVQGNTGAPTISSDGLLIHTPMEGGDDPSNDREQVYLWTKQSFEGDLALEFEFMPKQHNGLSLLMLQATGMQREDFMADYPLRTTGSMAMVFAENVRSYHWEFFREMDDTRNDVASSALIKQPWQHPLAYYCMNRTLALNKWHRVLFVQDGPRLRGAIDGELVFDVLDNPFAHTSSYYQCGHVAIRCMTKTKNLHRNMRIYDRSLLVVK